MDEEQKVLLDNLKRCESVYKNNPSSSISYAIKVYKKELEKYN